MNRRAFIQKSVISAAALPLVLPLRRLRATPNLQPVADQTTGLELIKLPEGFSYQTMSWTGEIASTGRPIPARHDGMALVNGKEPSEQILLRNHELFSGDPIEGEGVPVYDSFRFPEGLESVLNGRFSMSGGVTGVFLKDGEYEKTMPLLGGTIVNCAGGVTPWDTWLTCEEAVMLGSNMSMPDSNQAQDHGYVFEVPPPHLGKASAKPIKEMGLFRHEAVAVDPSTGFAYLTEDNGPFSGFYRFVPSDVSGQVGSLENGGELFMLRVKGQANLDLTKAPQGSEFDVEWIPISEPDSKPEELISYGRGLVNVGTSGRSGPFLEGSASGGAIFGRGEGIWEHDGLLYWVDTAGGPVGIGSVWIYDPNSDKLKCTFASKSERHADSIDNITVNPTNGRLVLCEDGGLVQDATGGFISGCRLLMSTSTEEGLVPIAENTMDLRDGVDGRPHIEASDYRSSEFAGAVFSKDGQTLYVNIQSPGVTFAITGPWQSI